MNHDQQEQSDQPHESAQWNVKFSIEKREGDWSGEQISAGEAPDPYEVVEGEKIF